MAEFDEVKELLEHFVKPSSGEVIFPFDRTKKLGPKAVYADHSLDGVFYGDIFKDIDILPQTNEQFIKEEKRLLGEPEDPDAKSEESLLKRKIKKPLLKRKIKKPKLMRAKFKVKELRFRDDVDHDAKTLRKN